MTDDELDRALAALPLVETPAGLHDRILAATIYRAPAVEPFRTWELWAVVVLAALAITATSLLLTSVPHAIGRSEAAAVELLRSLGLLSRMSYVWLAVGISCVWAISSLPLMPSGRRPSYNG